MLIHNIQNKGMPQNEESLSLKGNTLEYMFSLLKVITKMEE